MPSNSQIYVLIEHHNGELLKPSLETLGEALDLAETAGDSRPALTAVLLSDRPETGQALIEELAKFGPPTILAAYHPGLTQFSASTWAAALLQTLALSSVNSGQSAALLLLAATPNGRELAPRLAVALGAGLVVDSVRVRQEMSNQGQIEIVATVPLYGDRLYSQQQISSRHSVVSFRPGARGLDRPGERGNHSPEIIELNLETHSLPVGTQHLSFVPADPRTVTLSEAERIVCGGAGVGQERFDLMWELADEVGAAVGGTRVAVDKGWLEWDRQIGQTGQIVAPRLFISCGTSGASQHITGMKDARTVIAINSDRNAPIFALADIGVVGNVHEIIPGLIRKLRQFKASANLAQAAALLEQEQAQAIVTN